MKTPSSRRTWPILLVVLVSTLASTFIFYGYQIVRTPNVLVEGEDQLIYIPTGATYQTVLDTLHAHDAVQDPVSFGFVARLMGYQERVHPGAYRLRADMNNYEAVSLLRSRQQEPVDVTFNNVRLKGDLVERVTANLEARPDALLSLLNQPDTVARYGFDTTTVVSMFLPNTYEFYWNTDAAGVFRRMHREYERFWNAARRARADSLGLTPQEVSVLASIVQAETQKTDEMPRVAGVYLNRLQQGWPLDADPTVVFAVGDFSLRRVLNVHKEIDSPYNTYRNPGLPPGPINVPSSRAIDAVLNAEDHAFMFFCAREDFSGYHNFARTLSEHNRNARRYQRALDAAGIR